MTPYTHKYCDIRLQRGLLNFNFDTVMVIGSCHTETEANRKIVILDDESSGPGVGVEYLPRAEVFVP